MKLSSLLFFAALACACSDGPGRTPFYLDASAPRDAGPPESGSDAGRLDSGFLDAGLSDGSGGVGLPDVGPRPSYPMTGIFVSDEQTFIYARELNGALSLVLDSFPYVYEGTIDSNGQVQLESQVLERSGCAETSITGTYERAGAVFDFQHQTCSSNGAPLQSRLRGGFASDFGGSYSGVYQIDASPAPGTNCLGLGPGPFRLHWAINMLSGGVTSIFTGIDGLSVPSLFIGRYDTDDGSIRGIQQLTTSPGAFEPHLPDPTIEARWQQVSLLDPLRFLGQRTVYDVERQCLYTLRFEGQWVAEF